MEVRASVARSIRRFVFLRENCYQSAKKEWTLLDSAKIVMEMQKFRDWVRARFARAIVFENKRCFKERTCIASCSKLVQVHLNKIQNPLDKIIRRIFQWWSCLDFTHRKIDVNWTLSPRKAHPTQNAGDGPKRGAAHGTSVAIYSGVVQFAIDGFYWSIYKIVSALSPTVCSLCTKAQGEEINTQIFWQILQENAFLLIFERTQKNINHQKMKSLQGGGLGCEQYLLKNSSAA